MMTELEQVVDRGNRGRFWFLVAIGALCLVIAGLTAYAIYVNVKQGKAIAKVESPCLKYGPDSKQCEEAFSAAVSTITHPQACAIVRKAGTLRAIRELAADVGVDLLTEPCAGARLAQERERRQERSATSDAQGAEADGHGPLGERDGEEAVTAHAPSDDTADHQDDDGGRQSAPGGDPARLRRGALAVRFAGTLTGSNSHARRRW